VHTCTQCTRAYQHCTPALGAGVQVSVHTCQRVPLRTALVPQQAFRRPGTLHTECVLPAIFPFSSFSLYLDVFSAKNVILAGVKAVTLHDTVAVQQEHLSAQFFLSEADVGKNRAEACAAKLQELNTAVAVSVVTTEISEAHLASSR